MKPIVYIAGPYTATTIDKRNANIEAASAAGRDLLAKGYVPIVPHANTAGWELDPRFKHVDFLEMDFVLLDRADCVCLVGDWQKSKGTLQEIDRANANGQPVYVGVESVPPVEQFQQDCTSRTIERLLDRRRIGVDAYGVPLGHLTKGKFNSTAEALAEILDLAVYLDHELLHTPLADSVS